MNYNLIKDTIQLVEAFEAYIQNENYYSNDVDGFKYWIANQASEKVDKTEPDWEGKDNGRSPESTINTLLQHVNRYAKIYSKSAIHNSGFSTQEEFIYLINLKAFGAMSKMDLIKKNVHDKPVGMQIINRLIKQGWVEQKDSEMDKRSKVISITQKGVEALEQQMQKIRQATKMVTGNLTYNEKLQLIRLLQKLVDFHQPVYHQNIAVSSLLDRVSENGFSVESPSSKKEEAIQK